LRDNPGMQGVRRSPWRWCARESRRPRGASLAGSWCQRTRPGRELLGHRPALGVSAARGELLIEGDAALGLIFGRDADIDQPGGHAYIRFASSIGWNPTGGNITAPSSAGFSSPSTMRSNTRFLHIFANSLEYHETSCPAHLSGLLMRRCEANQSRDAAW